MNQFASKVVLITGSSSGFGTEIAKAFAKQKANLILTGRNVERLETVANDCRKLGAAEVFDIVADIEKVEDIENLVHKSMEKFQTLDILVNNAAIFILSNIETMSDDVFDTTFKVNVKAPMKICQLTLPYLQKSKGNIINISSIISDLHTFPSSMIYGMSKAALDKFTKLLAVELAGKGIRVNSVNSSASDTPLIEKLFPSEEDRKNFLVVQEKLHILGQKNIDPEEVVDAVLYLASDSASAITGSILNIDRGRVLTGQ